MTTDRVDIVVTDKVAPGTAKNLRNIGDAAKYSDNVINKLNTSLRAVDSTSLARLSTASAKLTNATAREISATARLENARARTAGVNARVAVTEQKLATEKQRTIAATSRSTIEETRSAVAKDKAKQSTINLALANSRLQLSNEKIVASSVATETAVHRRASAEARATTAAIGAKTANEKLAQARAKMAGETSKAARAAQQLTTEQARTESATERASAAAVRARTALLIEESASIRLAAAKRREALAHNGAAAAAVKASAASLAAAGGAGLAAHQTQNLVYQVNDIVVSLAAGQKPMTVLLQQGSQISTVFGPGAGLTRIMKGLGLATLGIAKQFLPVIVAAGVAATIFGALAHEINATSDVAVTMGDTFKASFQLISESIYRIIQPGINAIAPWFTAVYNTIIQDTKILVNGVIGFFMGTATIIVSAFNDLPATWNAIWASTWNGLLTVTQSALVFILNDTRNTINGVTALFVGSYGAVVAVWGVLPDAFARLGALAMNGLVRIIELGIKGVIGAVDGLLTFIGSAAEAVGASNPFADLINADDIVDLSSFKQTVPEVAQTISGAIADEFSSAFHTDFTQGIIDAVNLSDARVEITSAAKIIADDITSAFTADYAGSAFAAIKERAVALSLARAAAETDEATATGGAAAALSRKLEILQEIQGPLQDHLSDVSALTDLYTAGAISLGQFNQAFANLALVSDLRAVDIDLAGTPFADAAKLDEVRIAEQERLNIVRQALEARIISEQSAAERIVAINRQASKEVQEIEAARNSMILMGASDTFSSLAEAARGFAGEQSGIYKNLFILSKGFAIADSIIKIQQGVANAISLPFPANLAAVGVVAAQSANIVSSIQAVQFKRDGGQVTGPGGPRDDKIPHMLSNKEFVVNARDAQRNLSVLRAMNNGADIQREMFGGRQLRDGGEVQRSYRAPAPNQINVGTPSVSIGDVVVNISTRDPDTTVTITKSQQAAANARAVNYGQRNL